MTRLTAILLFAGLALPTFAICPDAPTFTQASYPTGGVDPTAGFIGDVNEDGRGDLVVFYNTGSGFQVFLGSATETLTPMPPQFVGVTTFSSMAGADLNNDGFLDVIGGTSSLHIYYGNGTGVFTAGPVLSLGGCGGPAVKAGDFDNNGLLDLAAINVCNHFFVFRQTSAGTFATPTDLPVQFPGGLDVGHLDGDGLLDAVVTTEENKVVLLFGDGNGQFTSSTIDLGAAFLQVAHGAAIADLNGDGRSDLAVGVVNRGIQILTNNGDRTFTLGALLPALGGFLDIADVNYDRVPDIVASGFGGFHIFIGAGDGTFGASQFTGVPRGSVSGCCERRRFVVGDLRGLGRVDVATATRFPMPQTIEVALNDCGPPPRLTAVDPSSGPTTGGNTVELRGENFHAPLQVLFGSTTATVVSSTPTSVTVIAPPHAPAVVSVSMITPGGTATLADAYAYAGPTSMTIQVAPTVAALRPFEIRAVITPAATAGSVSFFIDGVLAGTASVSGGVATFVATAPAALGPHTITAQFGGASIFGPSSATAAIHVAADIPALSTMTLVLLAGALAIAGALLMRT